MKRLYNDRHEKMMLEQQNKAYINQIKLVYDSQNALRYYRHDMRNHLFKMRDMVEKSEYKQLEEYIGQAVSYMKIDKKVIDSGNSEIDCLLNYKLRNIEEMNIKLERHPKIICVKVKTSYQTNACKASIL